MNVFFGDWFLSVIKESVYWLEIEQYKEQKYKGRLVCF